MELVYLEGIVFKALRGSGIGAEQAGAAAEEAARDIAEELNRGPLHADRAVLTIAGRTIKGFESEPHDDIGFKPLTGVNPEPNWSQLDKGFKQHDQRPIEPGGKVSVEKPSHNHRWMDGKVNGKNVRTCVTCGEEEMSGPRSDD